MRKRSGIEDDLEVCGLTNQDRALQWRGKTAAVFVTFSVQCLSRKRVCQRSGEDGCFKGSASVEPCEVSPSTPSWDLSASLSDRAAPEGSRLPAGVSSEYAARRTEDTLS